MVNSRQPSERAAPNPLNPIGAARSSGRRPAQATAAAESRFDFPAGESRSAAGRPGISPPGMSDISPELHLHVDTNGAIPA